MIDSRVVDVLIRIGGAESPVVPDILSDRDSAWTLIMRGDQPWRETAAALDEPALQNLIRGLVLFSRASGWSGGSVSPVVILYRCYEERFACTARALADWVIANRRNEYEPFGSAIPLAVRSRDESEEWKRAQTERRAANRADETRRQEQDAARRAERATRLLLNAVRRGDTKAVIALLDRGADPRRAAPAGETLLNVAEENGRSDLAGFLRSQGLA